MDVLGRGHGSEDARRTRRLASREVYRNAWMRVDEDDVSYPDGSTGTYGVVRKDDFALVVPWDGRRVCLVEQYRYVPQGFYLEFPQGADQSSTATFDAPVTAARELREETGLTADRLVPLGVLHEAYGFATQRAHIVAALGLTQETPEPEPSEAGIRHGWFSPDDFWMLQAQGRITDAVSVAAMALFDRFRLSPPTGD